MSSHSTDYSNAPLPPERGTAGISHQANSSNYRANPRAKSPRWWLPLTILLLGSVAFVAVWKFPLGDTEELFSNIVLYTIIVFTLVPVLGWLLLVRATRLATVVCLLLVVVGAAVAIDGVKFSGHMWISSLHFRWEPHPDDLLDQHRQGQSKELPLIDVVATLEDSPEYRGRHRDGVVIGPKLATDWDAHPPRQVWRQPCGAGHSSFAIVGNVAVTLEQRREQEAVVCYDLKTGRERWLHQYPALFSEALGGNGPRSTPTIDGDDVYAVGATGVLHCLDLKTGEVRWKVDVLEGMENVKWGVSGSPLVYKNVVLVSAGSGGGPRGTLAAYDRATGKYVWSAGKAHAGYSSPMLAKLGGREQVVLFDGAGVAGYDPNSEGKELWRYPWVTQESINAAQPLLLGEDRLLISSGYGVGSAVLHVSAADGVWSAKPVWKRAVQKTLRCKYSSPVLWDGKVYGLDEGILTCIDPRTGERHWRDGRYGHGQLLVTNGTLVVLSEQGELALVQASSDGYYELARFQALEGEPTWNVPVLVNGRVYVRNDPLRTREMACYDLTGR